MLRKPIRTGWISGRLGAVVAGSRARPHPVELGAAARVAADLGNTTLGTSPVSDGVGGGNKVRKALTPSHEEYH